MYVLQIEELDVEMRSLQNEKAEKAEYAAFISKHQKAVKAKLETIKHNVEYLQGFEKMFQEHEAKQQVILCAESKSKGNCNSILSMLLE